MLTAHSLSANMLRAVGLRLFVDMWTCVVHKFNRKFYARQRKSTVKRIQLGWFIRYPRIDFSSFQFMAVFQT